MGSGVRSDQMETLVDYLEECRAFRIWSSTNNICENAVSLWYSLRLLCEEGGHMAVCVEDRFLEILSGLTKSELKKARNKLIENGLIIYKEDLLKQRKTYHVVSLLSVLYW